MNITNEKLRIGACLALATLASQAARSQVTATFNPATGVLRVIGDAAPNQITVSDNGAGTILVNGGAILAVGGVPTRWNTTLIQVEKWTGVDTWKPAEVA